jgi:hypothetical protein
LLCFFTFFSLLSQLLFPSYTTPNPKWTTEELVVPELTNLVEPATVSATNNSYVQQSTLTFQQHQQQQQQQHHQQYQIPASVHTNGDPREQQQQQQPVIVKTEMTLQTFDHQTPTSSTLRLQQQQQQQPQLNIVQFISSVKNREIELQKKEGMPI